MLDSTPMSYCRKLIIVLLLALSVPAQSFAAISMNCVSAGVKADAASADHDMMHSHRAMHRVEHADNHNVFHHSAGHHAHSCSACASCCFGTAFPAVSTIAISPDAKRVVTRIPPSAGAVSFLTDGIERPPRATLV